MEFKDRIKILREEEKISYTELGAEFGKTEAAIRSWEVGRTKPDADTLIKLTKRFGCTTDYLLGLSNIKNQDNWLEKETMLNEFFENIDILSDEQQYGLLSSVNQAIEILNPSIGEIPISDRAIIFDKLIFIWNMTLVLYLESSYKNMDTKLETTSKFDVVSARKNLDILHSYSTVLDYLSEIQKELQEFARYFTDRFTSYLEVAVPELQGVRNLRDVTLKRIIEYENLTSKIEKKQVEDLAKIPDYQKDKTPPEGK